MQFNKSNKKHGNFVCLGRKYQLNYNQKLGEGVCGTVYAGCYYQDHSNTSASVKENKLLAIKEIPVNSKFESTDSMLQEINVLRRLKSPYIVRFIDTKKTQHNMYMIMEFCSGGTLEDFIKNKKDQLTENDVIKLMAQIVQGFKVLYKHKILHRDVKPANILLQDQKCKLADFGMAKIIDDTMGSNNYHTTYKGTPKFIAPQLIMREHYTAKSDIWSLGVTFYYMVFKTYPWNDANPMTLLNCVKEKVKEGNLIHKNAMISDELKDLLIRMLQFEEKDRISFEELFEHPVFNTYYKENPSEIRQHKNQQDIVNEDSQNEEDEDEDVTQFSVDCQDTNDTVDQLTQNKIQRDMAITEYQVTKKFQEQNEEASNCRKCLQQIRFEIEKAVFFKRCYKELEEQFTALQNRSRNINFISMNKSMTDSNSTNSTEVNTGENPIPDDLYQKCQFLLLKRSYIQIYDLYDLITFREKNININGNIELKQEYWDTLMRTSLMNYIQELQYYNEQIQKEKDQIQKMYQTHVKQFQQAQRTYQVFRLEDRGDAYNVSALNENKHLIMAFNDNFKELFQILGQELIQINYEKKMKNQAISKYSIKKEQKIDVLFVYDLILVLSFRNLNNIVNKYQAKSDSKHSKSQNISQLQQQHKNNINFEKYYEDRKLADCLELINRIFKVYQGWFESEFLENISIAKPKNVMEIENKM